MEGIRTLSIVAILLYHADPSWLPGGFFGVSVFFVLTGYLTTLSLERELERDGRLDYARFIVRRLARLVPSVVVAVGMTTVLCALFAHPLLPKLKSDALSALLFFENIHYIVSDVPYFAAAGLPSPLTHLWFLGVTMQFYLVWPLLLLLLRRVCPTRRALLVAVGALALASAIEMAVLYDPSDTSRVYYGLDTRAAELLVGALCALATEGAGWQLARSTHDGQERFPLPGWCYEVAGVAALALLVVMTFAIDGFSPLTYYGGTLVAALLAAVLVGVVCRGGVLGSVLGAPPLVAAGAVSFSLYLWHYPLLLVMNPATRTTELPWWGWVLEFALIAVASVASYVFVERGEGRPWLLGQSRVRVALYAVTAVALLVLAVAPIESAQTGVPVGQQAESSQEVVDQQDAEGSDDKDESEKGEEEDAEKDEVVVPDPSDYTVDPETGVTDAEVLLVRRLRLPRRAGALQRDIPQRMDGLGDKPPGERWHRRIPCLLGHRARRARRHLRARQQRPGVRVGRARTHRRLWVRAARPSRQHARPGGAAGLQQLALRADGLRVRQRRGRGLVRRKRGSRRVLLGRRDAPQARGRRRLRDHAPPGRHRTLGRPKDRRIA